ncbi:hypothetical protein E4U21_007835 [Claviceps maximensis]|nr:hypothetical protein E4U21_007835 [Claviceps maximensis]
MSSWRPVDKSLSSTFRDNSAKDIPPEWTTRYISRAMGGWKLDSAPIGRQLADGSSGCSVLIGADRHSGAKFGQHWTPVAPAGGLTPEAIPFVRLLRVLVEMAMDRVAAIMNLGVDWLGWYLRGSDTAWEWKVENRDV